MLHKEPEVDILVSSEDANRLASNSIIAELHGVTMRPRIGTVYTKPTVKHLLTAGESVPDGSSFNAMMGIPPALSRYSFYNDLPSYTCCVISLSFAAEID